MRELDSQIITGEGELAAFARALALILTKGDWVALCGELGAGKTAFARAAINYMSSGEAHIPSPSFTLLQTYSSPQKGVICHADFYRLGAAEEILELGFPDLLPDNISFIEWAERASELLPPARFIITLDFVEGDENTDENIRVIKIQATEKNLKTFAAALKRQNEITEFLAKHDYPNTRFLIAGDASGRRYERVINNNKSAILMDWHLDGENDSTNGGSFNGGREYINAARLAPDLAAALRVNELLAPHINTPQILAHDTKSGLLLQQDFGTQALATTPLPQRAPIYLEAVETLLALHQQSAPKHLPAFDGELWAAEANQFISWYLPYKNIEISEQAKQDWQTLWQNIGDEIMATENKIILRDYHSPNLLWLGGRLEGRLGGRLGSEQKTSRLGVIDFQDALRGTSAYDLASLLQDARIDVAADTQSFWLEHYLTKRFADNILRDEFLRSYALCATQRNFKILGIFARLALRDNKPDYLKHLPRIKTYINHTLSNPSFNKPLAPINDWLENNLGGKISGKL